MHHTMSHDSTPKEMEHYDMTFMMERDTPQYVRETDNRS